MTNQYNNIYIQDEDTYRPLTEHIYLTKASTERQTVDLCTPCVSPTEEYKAPVARNLSAKQTCEIDV